MAASVIQLAAAGIVCDEADSVGKCEKYEAYAVAVGAVSTFFSLTHFLLSAAKPGLADKFAPALSTFLVLWWIPGAGVPTFQGPFRQVGNGYFASWVAFFAAAKFFMNSGLAMFAGVKKSGDDAPAGGAAAV